MSNKLTVSLGKYDHDVNNPKIILGQQDNWQLDNVGAPEAAQYVDDSKLAMPEQGQIEEDDLDKVIRELEMQINDQEREIDALELEELQLVTQKNMLKALLIGPLTDLHNKVKDEVEDEFVNIRQVAPGPDSGMFNQQQEEFHQTLLSKNKKGKSQPPAQNTDKKYDPNVIKEWGEKVTKQEINQKAYGLITGQELEMKRQQYINKRDTSELLQEDQKLKFGNQVNQKMEEKISKQKKDERANSRLSKEENQSGRNSTQQSGRSGSKIGSARKRVGSARSSARMPEVPKPVQADQKKVEEKPSSILKNPTSQNQGAAFTKPAQANVNKHQEQAQTDQNEERGNQMVDAKVDNKKK